LIDCLAFGAHPDDVELFCCGVLIKLKKQGYTTGIVDITRGELSTNGDIKSRQLEADKASKLLDLNLRENLNLPDGNIENTIKNREKVVSLIRKIRPKICLLPYWQDRHPDHVAASLLLKDAIFYAGLPKVETNLEAYRPETVLYYMLHWSFEPTFIVDISKEFERKMEAISAYASQFNKRDVGLKQTYINKPQFLESIETRAKFFGQLINQSYGEPFLYEGKLKIDNLIQFFTRQE
jgi:bacillithiol biosynthesis deacetylase BshB1